MIKLKFIFCEWNTAFSVGEQLLLECHHPAKLANAKTANAAENAL